MKTRGPFIILRHNPMAPINRIFFRLGYNLLTQESNFVKTMATIGGISEISVFWGLFLKLSTRHKLGGVQ